MSQAIVNGKLTGASAPTSAHETFGTVAKPSRLALGCTLLIAALAPRLSRKRKRLYRCKVVFIYTVFLQFFFTGTLFVSC